jgi:hypothetical protein
MLKEERKGLISKRRPTLINNLTPQRDSSISIKNLTPKEIPEISKGKRKEKYLFSYQCYHCDKMGHISNNFPSIREQYKKRNKKNTSCPCSLR